jgi:hypothetical protein
MKQFIFAGIILIIGLMVGALWLYGQPSTPTVGAPMTTSPTTIPTNTSATVLITSLITDPRLIPGSVNLVRLNDNNVVIGIVGVMHDDGENGDVVAGDHVYSLQLALNEPAQRVFEFEVSAAFKGFLRRIISSPIEFAAVSPVGESLADLVPSNGTIVLGTVTNQGSSLNSGEIVTTVTLAVTRVLEGSASSSSLLIEVPGGTLGSLTSLVSGAPSFSTGETVVVILGAPNAQGIYTIPDLALGTYHIQTNPTGQIAIVDSDYAEVDVNQVPSQAFSSFLQRSAAGQVLLSELYADLHVSP